MPTCTTQYKLTIGEDNLVRFDKVRLASDGSYINSGSGTWELFDTDGTTSLGTGALSYVTASNGRWHGTIPSTVTDDLLEGSTYKLVLDFDNGSGADAYRVIYYEAGYHGAED
jgi:hypothetical protein